MSRRKAEMVLELIDRATRPARRFIALQRRMGAAVERANRLAQRTANAAQRATTLYTRAVQGLSRAQDALQRGVRRSNDLIRRQISQMRTATGLMRSGFAGIGQTALIAGGIFTAYSGTVAAAGAAMLGPARQFEKFQTILTTTEGSAQAAKKAMGWVENFAVKTPYELDQVMDAFVQLRAYGLDPTNGMLESLGNASAAMGKPLMQSVEAMADAVTGENERLKELGIKAAKVGKYFEYSYTGKDGSTKIVKALASDREAIQRAILGIFDEKYAGSMDMLSKTFDGMMSNIMDIWTKFQRMIMESGVFDWMKGKLSLILETLNAWEADGRLAEYAKAIGDHITGTIEAMWSFGADMVRFWQRVYLWLQRAADALGGWRNLALAVLAIPLRGVILGGAMAFLQLAGGVALAVKALAGLSFGAMAGGVLRLARGFLFLLNPINLVKAAFVALRVALISTGIGALVVGLAMAGTWVYNNWSGLLSFFQGFGSAFMEALGPARPIAEGLISLIRKLWGWISKLVGPLDASAEQWAEWGRKAGQAVGSVVRFIIDLPGKVMSGLRSGWQGVSSWIANMWPNLAGVAQRAWDALKSVLLNYTPAGLIYQHWDSIAVWAEGVWPDLAGSAQRAWDALKAVLLNYTPAGLIYQHWGGIAAWAEGVWPDLAGSAQRAWEALKAVLLNYTPAGLIYQHWDGMAAWAEGVWPDLAGSAQRVWEALKAVLLNYTPAGLIYQHWDGIAAWAEGVWPDLAGVAQRAWEALKAVLLTYTPAGLIYQHWDSIAVWAEGVWPDLAGSAQRAWDALKAVLLNYTPAGLIYQHWDGIAAWAEGVWPDLAGSAQRAWEALKAVLLTYTPAGLIYQHWDGIAAWAQDLWPDIAGPARAAFNALKSALMDYNPASLIYTHWDGLVAWFEALWAKLPSIDWAELINLQGIKDAWNSVTAWFSEAAGKLWDLLPEMPQWKFSLWGEEQVDDPKTLLAAAEAADRLERQFPAIDRAAQAALANAQATITAISTLMAGADYANEGARMMQSLADGIRSKIAEVTAAAQEITQAIRSALPSSATLNISAKAAGGGKQDVQARAAGGAFRPGWLLTGENGPELEYRNHAGFIAHNRALRSMVGMSRNIARNMSDGGMARMGRAAAVGGAMATAMPAAADMAQPSGQSEKPGAQYLTERNRGSVSVSAPFTINIQGNVDANTMPDLKATLSEFEDRLMARLAADARATRRREHD